MWRWSFYNLLYNKKVANIIQQKQTKHTSIYTAKHTRLDLASTSNHLRGKEPLWVDEKDEALAILQLKTMHYQAV